MNDIVDNLAEVFLCALIMYNIKLFFNDIKRYQNMAPAYKYFYVVAVKKPPFAKIP